MENKLIEQLKEILEIEDREINLEDKFREYKEWDSLAYLSVIAMIDEEFDVVIETADFKKLLTVGDMLEAIKNLSK
ncbi:MAG: acyl carrier protein [Bacteroidota bacterium]